MIRQLGFILLFAALGCTQKGHDLVKRDRAFFDRFINPATHVGQAAEKLNELKLIEGKEVYQMRYALFDDGQFFYQVDNLGSGYGTWTFKDGVLNLFSSRTFFDLDLYVSAARPEGEAVVMQFTDRFGANTVNVALREPNKSSPLKKFRASKKNL